MDIDVLQQLQPLCFSKGGLVSSGAGRRHILGTSVRHRVLGVGRGTWARIVIVGLVKSMFRESVPSLHQTTTQVENRLACHRGKFPQHGQQSQLLHRLAAASSVQLAL